MESNVLSAYRVWSFSHYKTPNRVPKNTLGIFPDITNLFIFARQRNVEGTKQENEKIKGETKGSYPNRKEKTVVWNRCLGKGES
ncbi:hypothetical protein [Neobacillus soli]|uniref:hypothetical protein n=1 Tax=Neobacillus soli TaxID=220688 RepID=UPI001155849C|nr:hypothetical protein [Neobacillus soli]